MGCKNGFAYVLLFFSLISEGLGSVDSITFPETIFLLSLKTFIHYILLHIFWVFTLLIHHKENSSENEGEVSIEKYF